jgi:transposase-like protein
MTDDRMALLELVEKQADGDLVREMLAFAADSIMEAEVEARTGAAKGARSPLRGGPAQRIPRPRLGHSCWPDHARDPEVEKGKLSAQLLEPRRTAEKALVAVI